MAHQVCREIGEWIEEEISKPVEEWEERQEERCKEKECNWWILCLNKLICWLVWILVKVIRWVIVTVAKWVVRTVCSIITTIAEMVVGIATGLWEVIVGIFTWDWARVFDGLVTIVVSIIGGVFSLVRIIFLGDTIDFIREEINKKKLRDYVRKLLEERFAGDPKILQAAKDAIGVDFGAFGLRLNATASRAFVNSTRQLTGDPTPLLIQWHEDPALDIDIRKLAGYDWDNFWKRSRPEVENGDEDEVDAYIENRGGKSFLIYSMSGSLLRSKINTTEERARELGLMLKFVVTEHEITDPSFVRLTGSSSAQDQFNVSVLGRADESIDPIASRIDLCRPSGGGVFAFDGSFLGYSSHLYDSTCLDGSPFPSTNTSGVSFLDLIPDFVYKYIFVHELGHYFGLCHVDGLNRIMYTANKKAGRTWWSWMLIPEYIYLEGGPRFVLDEAKLVWDYIIGDINSGTGFPTECLTTRAH